MGIFKDMYEQRMFPNWWEYGQLNRMLSEAISRGYVEKVPVMHPHPWSPTEAWYRDKETGEIYSLIPPEEKNRGQWRKVLPEDLIKPDEKTQ